MNDVGELSYRKGRYCSIQKSGTSFLPFALRTPGILLVHTVNFSTFAWFATNTFGRWGSIRRISAGLQDCRTGITAAGSNAKIFVTSGRKGRWKWARIASWTEWRKTGTKAIVAAETAAKTASSAEAAKRGTHCYLAVVIHVRNVYRMRWSATRW